MLLIMLVVAGCSINGVMRPDSYTVQRGDTLSGIARKHHIDWHKLARWNHIGPPYRINVGQQLTLKPYPQIDYAAMSDADTPPSDQAGQQRPPDPRGETRPLASPDAPVVTRNPQPADRKSDSDRGRQAPARNTARQQAATQDENSIDSATSSAATRQTAVKAGGPSEDGWQWPASGSLLRSYDASARRRGIEIGGKLGAPIHAASSGTVVYNGSGLKGYGKLIIIKHDERYLSAYGFVDKSLVKQGQTVAAGRHIADMGLGPGNEPMLHFEIRRDGDPIDPQKTLPER